LTLPILMIIFRLAEMIAEILKSCELYKFKAACYYQKREQGAIC
jgi:hypothetical protein